MLQNLKIRPFGKQVGAILPFGLTVILVLYSLTPSNLPGFSEIAPMYSLVAVYFWTLYRPEQFGYILAFSIGMLEDVLTGMPIGITALTLLLAQWLVFNQQMFFHGKSFIITWYAFFIVCAGAFFIKWFFINFIQGSGFSGDGNIVVSYLMTIVVYPVIAWLFSKIQLALVGGT